MFYSSYQQYQQVLWIFRVFLRYSPCRAIELPRSKNIITAVRYLYYRATVTALPVHGNKMVRGLQYCLMLPKPGSYMISSLFYEISTSFNVDISPVLC